MRYVSALITSFLFIAPAASQAQTVVSDPPACSKSFDLTARSAYKFTDNASVGTYNPVIQGGPSATCGNWSFGIWSSYELSSKPYGDRGYGDEWDFSVFYNKAVDSPVGKLELEGSAAYWLLSKFTNVNDDLVDLYAGVGRPFVVGSATLTPFVRMTEWLGVKTFPNTTLFRAGMRYSYPLTKELSVSGSLSESWVVSPVPFRTAEANVNLAEQLSPNWSVTVGAQSIEHTQTVYSFGFRWVE